MELKKNHKVKSFRAHIGVQIGSEVFSSLSIERQKVDMELCPHGVIATMNYKEGVTKTFVVPFANIHSVELLTE